MTDTRPDFPAPGLPGAAAMTAPASDPDLDLDPDDELDGPGSVTPLDAIVAELTADLDDEATLEVPARAGWAVVYGLDIDHHLLGQWQKRAKDPSQPNQFDELRFASTVLAAKARRILRGGVPIRLEGAEVDFRAKALHELLGVGRHLDAVRKVYGRDAHVVTACKELLGKAGYSDDVMTADPTEEP